MLPNLLLQGFQNLTGASDVLGGQSGILSGSGFRIRFHELNLRRNRLRNLLSFYSHGGHAVVGGLN